MGNDLVPCTVTARGSEGDLADIAESIGDTMIPASRNEIEAWIAELSTIAPSRAEDEFTVGLKIEAYVKRLSEYPADIVRHGLLECKWRFFPSWYELEEILSPMRSERKAMLDACLAPYVRTERQEQQSERLTADRASEIMEEVGFRPKKFGAE